MLEEAVVFEYGMSWETSAEALASIRAFSSGAKWLLGVASRFMCSVVPLPLTPKDQEAQGPSEDFTELDDLTSVYWLPFIMGLRGNLLLYGLAEASKFRSLP